MPRTPRGRGRANKETEVSNETVEEFPVADVIEPTNPETVAFSDVETLPDAEVDEVDTVEVATDEKTGKPKKEKAPARVGAPEGTETPVQFSKTLTKRLEELGRVDSKGKAYGTGEGQKAVSSQVIYSTINNNGPDSKNPFPTQPRGEGDTGVVVPVEAGIEWWIAKDDRMANAKKAKAEKASKKDEPAAEVVEAESQEPIVEVE